MKHSNCHGLPELHLGAEANSLETWQYAGFGLYVHWPFCQSKCPYCDFNSHVAGYVDHELWRNAYLSELQRYAEEFPGRVLTSIFFGGGTPSLMPPQTVESIIDEATRLWSPANNIEITLEANPTSAETKRLREFRLAGVNRISVGVQALNDADLRRLGRMHTALEAKSAIAAVQGIFDRSSFDLIYARQDQTLVDWEAELKLALTLADDHLSLYQLTIEPNTVFGARHDRGQLLGLPSEDLTADMYELTQAICNTSNRPAYEVSNHCRPGNESRHNIIYWRCGDYVGIGPGAHGRLTDRKNIRFSTECPKSPHDWLTRVQQDKSGESSREVLSSENQANEMMIMGLRLNEGVELARYNQIAGRALSSKRLQDLVSADLIRVEDGYVRTSPTGRMVLNWVITRLFS